MTPEEIQKNYRDMMLALCKYHQNLKEESEELRDSASKMEEENPQKRWSLTRANTMSNQRKAVLWMLFRQKDVLIEFFATDQPEIIATHPFYDPKFTSVDNIPAQYLGVQRLRKKKLAGHGTLGKTTAYRLRGIEL